jgi:transcriptional regulator with XRE-family HTH domain
LRLSVHAVSALERGERRRPHVETVRALSAALDLTGATRDALLGSARAPGLAQRLIEERARLGPERWARAYAAGRVTSIDSLLKDIDSVLRSRPRA